MFPNKSKTNKASNAHAVWAMSVDGVKEDGTIVRVLQRPKIT